MLISGENVGWPVDRSAKGDSLRAAIKAENIEREKQNAALRKKRLCGLPLRMIYVLRYLCWRGIRKCFQNISLKKR